jgi:elongation factor Ts
MAVTIEQIKELREITGVSMSACKKALEENDGDLDKSIDSLRKKGEAKAADRAGRSTDQGVIAIKENDGKASMVKLLSETDFVSKGDDFQALADGFVEKLLAGEIKADETDLPELKEAVMKMGENIKIGEMAKVEGSVIGAYVHSNKKIGVLVVMDGGTEELAKDIAMHAAATAPKVLSPDEVDQALVDKEKEIWTEQLAQEGKPAEIIDKIMMGKEKKFREDNALVKQKFVKDPEKTIEQLLSEAGCTVVEFVRFAI